MAQRIRTVKPDLFTHESLFDAEFECGLLLRLSFIGLWTCADREGRFPWRPRMLKTNILPYDDVDFARVLDALHKYGFINRYEVDGQVYGCIPSFSKHQRINQREAQSQIPPCNDDACACMCTRNNFDVCTTSVVGEGNMEGNKEWSKEGKDARDARTSSLSDSPPSPNNGFDAFWALYPCKQSKQAAVKEWEKLNPDSQLQARMMSALKAQMAMSSWQEANGKFVPHPSTWIKNRRWEDEQHSPRKSPDQSIGGLQGGYV